MIEMATESYKERQDDELQVLQAILLEDFKDLRQGDAWRVNRPPEVCLTLRPQESVGDHGEVYVQLDLIFNCHVKYPDVVPEIRIENSKGLSDKQLSVLKCDLEKEAEKLKGQEMMLELSQFVKDFLYANNKPPPKSFYDEMMSNKKKLEEKQAEEIKKKQEQLRKKEEKEMLLIEDQIQKRKEALKEETRRMKEEARQATGEKLSPVKSPVGSPSDAQSVPNVQDTKHSRRSVSPAVHNYNDEDDKKQPRKRGVSWSCSEDNHKYCKHHTGGIVVLAFNTKSERIVHRGRCLGHGVHGSTVYAGIDTKTGDLVAISEWVLKWRHLGKKSASDKDTDKEGETYMKQVITMEQEMSSLLKLSHRHLLHYLAFKYEEEPGKITIYVLMEYSGGQNLDIYLTRKTLTMAAIRLYCEEMLLALEYLHNKDVTHKNLRASSVFIDMNARVRLADYSINKKLCDLYQSVEDAKPGVKFSKQSTYTGKGNKKEDVFQLGTLLLSLSQGSAIDDVIPTVPHTLPDVFQDFLAKCLMRDDKLRWSCSQLLDHQFVKEPLPPLLTMHDEDMDKKAALEDKDDNSVEDEEELSPLITAWEASGQSRLTNEFDVLKSLGKGGFGDVIKVKNKLDGRLYAIKRIPLNPKSQQFNRKITREVKLLSRLNHENVVRYYNSWIETSDEPAESSSSSSLILTDTPKTSDLEKKIGIPGGFNKDMLDVTDDLEKFAPQINSQSVDFSISFEPSRSRSHGFHGTDSDTSSDEDDEEPEDVFGLSFMGEKSESSDGIIFEHDLDIADDSVSNNDGEQKKAGDLCQNTVFVPKQYLYIQMEYCEKSTLRNCIDAGLYLDMDRVWRLFREIVEGLVHIHEQGMIHRDLKPVNIFLDSNDHVKIGDFGLATSDIISKNSLKEGVLMNVSVDIHDMSSRSGSLGDGNLTGQVGTALYVSPEMMSKQSRGTYSQKVDIYSLGIIFFEMCYKPLPTGMERVKILGDLRSKDITLPDDFDQTENMENQCHILRWLLNHDYNERPTSKELLKSDYIPPSQMEEAELNEVLRSAISDPQSKSYHRMISALFSQTVSLADDHVYDSDMHKGSITMKTALTQRLVDNTLVKVFQLHGAIKLNTPLLMPRQNLYENLEHYPCLMDHSGRLVGLPFDLRVPFARFITRTSTNYIKRYCIDRVYRKKKVGGFHPRELTECAFDIVTANPICLIPDAEVLVVVQDIINEFPPLQQRNYYVRLNHTSLLKAVLIHCGIPEDQHISALTALAEIKRDSKSKGKLLSALSISDQSLSLLLNLMETEGPFSKINSLMRMITKTKGQAGSLAKQGLHEMEAVITKAEHLGLKLPVTVSVGWVYSLQMYDGVTFQVAVDITRKKKTVSEVLATGGRYDILIKKFEPRHSILTPTVSKQSGVGVSIAFEKIVSAMLEQAEFQPPSAYDVLVCTIGHKPMEKERMNLVRELWSAGLKAEILHETLEGQEEIQDYCRVHGISHLVILKDSEGSSVRVRSIEKEKITEKVMSASLLVEFLQQKLQASDMEPKSSSQLTGSKLNQSNISHQENVSQSASSGGNVSWNFNFVHQEGKMASNVRRKHEAQIVSQVNSCFPWLSLKCVEVIAVELPSSATKVISAFLEVDSSEKDFESSISTVIEKLPRYKKYMSKITDQIHTLVFEKKCSCIVIYSLKDEKVKLLTSS